MSISTVCPDEVETGRVQGRQMRALVPAGRRVLYIQGSPRSLASRQRTAGMQEATAGAPFEVVLAGGTGARRSRAARCASGCASRWAGGGPSTSWPARTTTWRAASSRRSPPPPPSRKPETSPRIPVAGCDGAPDIGQKMVRDGRLVATVVLPRVAGPAVDEVAALLARGARPAPVITHAATSFPPLDDLKPIA